MKSIFTHIIPVNERFSRGFFWNVVNTFFTQGSNFFTSIVLARLLNVGIYGEYSMIQNTLLTVTGIAQVSVGITVTKYVAEFRDTNKVRSGRILGLCSLLTLSTGILASILLLLFSRWVSEHVIKAPYLESSLILSVPFVLFSVMNAYQIGGLAGLESYKNISKYNAVLGVLNLLMCCTGAFFGGLNGLLLCVVIVAFLRWAIYSKVLHREAKKHQIFLQYTRMAEESVKVFRFLLPAALAGLFSMAAIWISNAFLVQQTNGYSEMGVYTAIYNLKTLFLLIPSLINGVATSILNNHKGQHNETSFNSTFFSTIRLTLLISMFGAFCMFMDGEFLIKKLFGEAYIYDGTKLLISLMSVQVVVEAVGIAVYQVIQAQEMMWKSLFYIAFPRDVIIVITAYFSIPVYGAVGLAAAMLAGIFFALTIKILLAYWLKYK